MSFRISLTDQRNSPPSDYGAACTLRLEVWRAALLGIRSGAALVIEWIALFRRVCLQATGTVICALVGAAFKEAVE